MSIVENAQRVLATKAFDALSDEVQGPFAVIPITSIQKVVKSAGNTASGASNNVWAATPSDKDFYLCRAQVNFLKNATCDVADGTLLLQATIDGAIVQLARYSILTLTAQEINSEIVFNPPIKLDRNTAITLNQGTFTAGKFTRCGTISGFTQETTSS